MNVKVAAAGLMALLVVVALYATRLSYAPIYLAADEVKFALQAKSLADSGRGLDGERFPVYFSDEFKAGRDPVSIYATALVVKLSRFSETTVRLPSALVGVLNVVLVFLLGRRLFKQDAVAAIAAGMLALSPAHFIHSRMAYDVVYPIPFALGWLCCLVAYLEDGRTSRLALAALLLGFGVYSYLPALFMMPLYLAGTLLLLYWRRVPPRTVLVTIGAFVLPLSLLVYWQVIHPERYAELFAAYGLTDARAAAGPQVEGVRSLVAGPGLSGRLDTYWNFFNPAYLFLTGDSSLVNSTRQVGVFLWPVAPFLAVGVWRILTGNRSPQRLLLLACMLTAPLAIVLMGAPEIRRVLLLLPFVALVAGCGVEWFFEGGHPGRRAVAAVLVGVGVLLFVGFYRDYMGPYRIQTARWFGGNTRGAFVEVIDRQAEGPSNVLVSQAIPYGDLYWSFYTQVKGRHDLRNRVSQYEPALLGDQTAAPGAWLITDAHGLDTQALASAEWEPKGNITEPDGTLAFRLFRRRY